MSDWSQKVHQFMSSYDRAYFYTADPGATSAIKPYYDAHVKNNLQVEWYVDGWAAHEYIPKSQNIVEDASFLPDDLSKNDVVIMGQQVDFDRAYQRLAHAKKSGATIVFISDHWKDISSIFKPNTQSKAILSDIILLPDIEAHKVQFKTFRAKGFTEEELSQSLKIFLHTGVEQSLERISSTTTEQQNELIRKYNIQGDIIIMLLDCVDRKGKIAIGFDWQDSLMAAINYAEKNNPNDTILVKPHPRQDLQEVQDFINNIKSPVKIKLAEEKVPEPLISIANQVWGMTTVLLVVALKANKQIKSFMPNRTAIGTKDSNAHIEPYVVL